MFVSWLLCGVMLALLFELVTLCVFIVVVVVLLCLPDLPLVSSLLLIDLSACDCVCSVAVLWFVAGVAFVFVTLFVFVVGVAFVFVTLFVFLVVVFFMVHV